MQGAGASPGVTAFSKIYEPENDDLSLAIDRSIPRFASRRLKRSMVPNGDREDSRLPVAEFVV